MSHMDLEASRAQSVFPDEVLGIVAANASPDTISSLCRVKKSIRALCLPMLYAEVTITRNDQYLPYLRNFTYDVLKGEYKMPRDAKKVAKAEAADRAGRPNPVSDLLRTLTLLAPPPANLLAQLKKETPALEIEAYSGSIAFAEEELDDPEVHQPITSCYVPVPIDKLVIHTKERDFGSFASVAAIFNPTHFHLKSLEALAMTWRTKLCVIQDSWLALEYLLMEDVLPLRPEQGDMCEGVAIPYLRCQRLRQMTVLIRKFDHPAGAGIASTIFYDIPGMNDKLFKLEKFLIRMTGKTRLAALRKSWEGEHKPRWEEQFQPGKYIYQDPERGERWVRMELADGPVGPCPDRVLSEDYYWYDRDGELLGEAGSSMDEECSDSEDDEDSEDEEDSDDEENWEDVE